MSREERNGKRLFLLALACASGVYGAILHRPLLWKLRVVPDDAFYYLQIARHLALNGVSTFDGVNLTNGYHPGWMLIVTLLAKAIPDRVALLDACLLTAFAFHLAAALSLVTFFRREVDDFTAWIGGACWLANPHALFLALQGVEASFYIFTLTLALQAYRLCIAPALYSTPPTLPYRQAQVLFGLSLSLAFWGRTEAALIAVLALLWLSRVWSRTFGVRKALQTGATIGGVFLAGILPWFAYSYLATGSLTQRSGAMKLLWASEEHAHFGLFKRLGDTVGYLLSGWLSYPVLNVLTDLSNLSSILGVLATLVLSLVLVRLQRQRRAPGLRRFCLSLLTIVFTLGCVYGLFYSDRQVWYQALPSLLLYVVCFLLGAHIWRHSQRAMFPAGAGAVAMMALLCLRLTAWPPTIYPWQPDVYTSQKRFETLVPPGEHLGCFNAGIPAYFSNRPILNLDGLANNALYPYYQAHRFDAYLRDLHLGYIADEELALQRAQRFTKSPVLLRPIASAPLAGWKSGRRWLWRATAEDEGEGW